MASRTEAVHRPSHPPSLAGGARSTIRIRRSTADRNGAERGRPPRPQHDDDDDGRL